MKSKELEDLELKINSNPKSINLDECISFLQNHKDQTENFSKYLFNISDRNNVYNMYIINRTKREIIRKIIDSLPTYLDVFFKPIFNLPNDQFQKNLFSFKYYKDIIKDSLSTNQLVEILQKVIQPPFNFFTKYFLKDDSEIRELFEPLNSEVYKEIDEELSRLKSTMERYKKTCYIPVVKHSDSSNPCVSKFGGVAPYLPINDPIFCDCGDKLQKVFSFHIPSIPDEMKKLFPSDHEYVVVGYTCNSCHIHQEVKCYSDEQIDQLVYDDVQSKKNVFNEPRTVVEWKESFMYPYGVNEAGFELPEKVSFNQEELLFIDDFLHEKNYGNKDLKTYLGGYPCFAQGDDRPNGHVLLLEIEESEASTNLWGDCGTAQVWMTTGSDFGSFIMQYNCS